MPTIRSLPIAYIYLIENQFVKAEYKELYGKEHEEIIAFIKQVEILGVDVTTNIDVIPFLFISKSYLTEMDFRGIQTILKKILNRYFKNMPQHIFECESFYYNASKILFFYNVYEELYNWKMSVISSILEVHEKLVRDGCICNNLSFGVNLLQYGLYNRDENIISSASLIIECYFSNVIPKTLDLKEAINAIYHINRLTSLNFKLGFHLLKEQIMCLLFDTKSNFYKMDNIFLSSLEGGIPRLIFEESINTQDLTSCAHVILLQ